MSVTPKRYQSLAKSAGSALNRCPKTWFWSQWWLGCGGAAIALWSGATLPAIAQVSPDLQMVQVPQRARAMNNLNLLYVNPVAGDDWRGQGGERSPFKTITKALQVAQPNTVIVLVPGTYSAETGESFPLRLKPGVTIQGNPRLYGKDTVIQGGGPFLSPTFASQNITILGVNQGGLAGVTVTNPNPRGYGLWIESASPVILENTFRGNAHDGISMTGSSAPTIRGNVFAENGANGMTIYGTARPEIRNNAFVKTGFGINIAEEARPLIVGNRILQNEDGIVVQAQARPVLRGNLIEGNLRDGLVAIAQAQPDLGQVNDPGNNIFNNNGRLDVNGEATSQAIVAVGNQFASDRTKGRLDLAGTMNNAVSQADAPDSTPAQKAERFAKAEDSTSAVIVTQVQPFLPRTTAQVPPVLSEKVVTAVASTPTEPQPTAKVEPKPKPSPVTIPVLSPEVARPAAAPVVQPSPAKVISTLPPTLPRSQPASAATASSNAAKPASNKPTISAAAFPAPSLEKPASTAAEPTSATTSASPLRSQPISAYSFRSRSPKPAARSSAATPASTPTAPAEAAAIAIPVPPPEAAPAQPVVQPAPPGVASRPLPKPAQQATPQPIASVEPSAVDIPVPPPETGSVVTVAPTLIPSAPVPSAPLATLSALGNEGSGSDDILPVPSPDIPVGEGGGPLPTVLVAQNPLDSLANLSPGNRSAGLGATYRVVVEVSNESEQAQVQSLVPGAFRTITNGRMLMQVGSYSDRANAEKMVGELSSQGLKASIE